MLHFTVDSVFTNYYKGRPKAQRPRIPTINLPKTQEPQTFVNGFLLEPYLM